MKHGKNVRMTAQTPRDRASRGRARCSVLGARQHLTITSNTSPPGEVCSVVPPGVCVAAVVSCRRQARTDQVAFPLTLSPRRPRAQSCRNRGQPRAAGMRKSISEITDGACAHNTHIMIHVRQRQQHRNTACLRVVPVRPAREQPMRHGDPEACTRITLSTAQLHDTRTQSPGCTIKLITCSCTPHA